MNELHFFWPIVLGEWISFMFSWTSTRFIFGETTEFVHTLANSLASCDWEMILVHIPKSPDGKMKILSVDFLPNSLTPGDWKMIVVHIPKSPDGEMKMKSAHFSG